MLDRTPAAGDRNTVRDYRVRAHARHRGPQKYLIGGVWREDSECTQRQRLPPTKNNNARQEIAPRPGPFKACVCRRFS